MLGKNNRKPFSDNGNPNISIINTKYEKVSNDLHVYKYNEDLFFCFEKIPLGFAFYTSKWYKLTKLIQMDMEKIIKTQDKQKNSRIPETKEQAILNAIIHFVPESSSKFCWVCYISNKKPLSDITILDEETVISIEMFMRVSAIDEFPISTHMGITRNPEYKGIKHKDISMLLHSWSACMTLKLRPDIKIMANNPLNSMKKIMLKALKISEEVANERKTEYIKFDKNSVTHEDTIKIIGSDTIYTRTSEMTNYIHVSFAVLLEDLIKISEFCNI